MDETVAKRPRWKDETGNRYGRLVVEKRYGSDRYGAVWLCRCDCGQKIAVPGGRLRFGNTKSCGCLREMTWDERAALGYWPKGKGGAAE